MRVLVKDRRRNLAAAVAGALLVSVCIVSVANALRSNGASDTRWRTGAGRTAAWAATRPKFPLKVSPDGRYLLDRRNAPFMIVGDSPQSMIANLSLADARRYVADRKAAGFNSLWVDLLCVRYTGCRADGATYDGINPFRTPGSLATPNPRYFQRADAMIRLAGAAGMAVFLDPIETGGWLGVLRRNGVAKDRAFGRFLGRRYRSFPNIVWSHGNDLQSWRNASDDAVVLAVAQGIRSVDHAHLQTVELDSPRSSSLDDPRWAPLIQLDAAYTYGPTYAEVLHQYNSEPFLPVFLVEAGYEFEQNNMSISKGTPEILRRQEYWTALSGSTGQFYGNAYVWPFAPGWKNHLDTRGSVQLGYLARLFAGMQWYRLVPHQSHAIVTGGYGTYTEDGNVGSSNYVTTASTPDGTLTLSYLPVGGTLTVDTSRLAPGVKARWFDPSNGQYRRASGLPLTNTGLATLTSPGKNADGALDWLLTLR
jgi:hypothetical protein